MVLILDNKYSIEEIKDSSWVRVLYEDELLALAMTKETARQVIYRDIHDNGGTCEYLKDDDFN